MNLTNNISPRRMLLSDLLDCIDCSQMHGSCGDTVVDSITADSRTVNPGTVFIALRGTAVDSHRFIPAAVEQGAVAVVAEDISSVPDTVVAVKVTDSRVALGKLASRFFGEPSEELTLVGVTGTNGKTTVATLLYELARMQGLKAGLISTVCNIIDERIVPADHTTPDPIQLNALLRKMVDAGCSFAAMEVSSHAADQHRISGLTFAGGIFTNLTRDHLDYHKTFAAYLAAKKSFFDSLDNSAFALSNEDDRNGAVMVQNTAARPVAFYSTRSDADFHVRIIESRLDGMLLDFDGDEVEVRLTGAFNASNLAAVYGAGILLGYPREQVLTHMSALTPAPGRFQTFRSPGGITAIVDYAHTPDALENVLSTISEIALDKSNIITVCGAGGDRDTGKRPLMAQVAAGLSDHLILTSDNPRSEDPEEILNQMENGLGDAEKAHTERITDRRAAIMHAVEIASPGDIILIAGKGHETGQTIGSITHHFDDREEIVRAFQILEK